MWSRNLTAGADGKNSTAVHTASKKRQNGFKFVRTAEALLVFLRTASNF